MNTSEFTIQMFLRFYEKIEFTDDDNDCWLWIASLDKFGYGHFGIKRKNTLTHRISYAIAYGEFPDHLNVLHSCDNPRCVNPKHLFLGTQKDNSDDMREKGRAVNVKGEANGRAKLTRDQVNTIRERFANGESKKHLAREYKVSPKNIRSIIKLVIWKED